MKSWQLGKALQWLYLHWIGGFALIVAFAAVGAFLAGVVFKPPYTADAVISVNFNADAVLRYPEDYKNWQMAQLDSFVTSPKVLGDVLAALPSDPYWQNWDVKTLAQHLSTHWFTAGDWHLHARSDTAKHASILAATWGIVALRDIQSAISYGTKFLEADREWEQAQNELLLTKIYLLHLEDAERALTGWQTRLKVQPSSALTPAQIAEMNYWAAFSATPDNPYHPLPDNATPEQARAWLVVTVERVRTAHQALTHQRDFLQQTAQRAKAEREKYRQASEALSTEWHLLLKGGKTAGVPQLEQHLPALWANTATYAKRLHPPAAALYSWRDGAAIGALAGVIIWALLAFIAALQREENVENG